MGKKRKLISHPQFWKKHANHPAVKARQAEEQLVKEEVVTQPKPEPVVKKEVAKPVVKPAAKPAVKSVAQPSVKKEVLKTNKVAKVVKKNSGIKK